MRFLDKDKKSVRKNKARILKRKMLIYLNIIILYSIIIFLTNTYNVFARDVKFVTTMYSAFSKIQKYITRMSTPIAGVAFGTVFLMRKFSFGDEEKVRKSKRLIRDTAVAYTFILCIDLILSLIETLVE